MEEEGRILNKNARCFDSLVRTHTPFYTGPTNNTLHAFTLQNTHTHIHTYTHAYTHIRQELKRHRMRDSISIEKRQRDRI